MKLGSTLGSTYLILYINPFLSSLGQRYSGLSKRFRVASDAKKVAGGPTKHKTHLTLIATLIILILLFVELLLFNQIKILQSLGSLSSLHA